MTKAEALAHITRWDGSLAITAIVAEGEPNTSARTWTTVLVSARAERDYWGDLTVDLKAERVLRRDCWDSVGSTALEQWPSERLTMLIENSADVREYAERRLLSEVA